MPLYSQINSFACRDCYEDELVPVFRRAGRIFEMRMMVDFSGANRGYCYVRYCKIEEAQKAIKTLDNFQIRPRNYLGVKASVDNKKLCLRTVPPIPTTYTVEKVLEEVKRVLDGAVTVRFLNKIWIQVEFSSHRNAALARRKVVPGNITIFQTRVIKEVDWALPDMEDYMDNHKRKTICVRNLPRNITKQRISRAFNFLSGGGGKVEYVVINPSSNCALVTFRSPKDAKSILDRGHNLDLDGQKAELSWCGAQEKEQEKEKPGGPSGQQQSREASSHSGQAEAQEGQQEGPVESLARLCVSHGWGVPQYSYRTALTPHSQVLYQSCLSFPARPGILVHGLPAFTPDLAAFSTAWTALEGISRSYLGPSVPPTTTVPEYPSYYYYVPAQAPEQTFTSLAGPQTFQS